MEKIMSLLIGTLSLSSSAFAQNDGYGHMNGGWHMMGGYGGFLMWILLIIGIILVVFLVMQLTKNDERQNKSQETALDILKKRYAKGEISKEEFERMKQDMIN